MYLRETHFVDALLEEASVTADLFPMLFKCSLYVCCEVLYLELEGLELDVCYTSVCNCYNLLAY